MKDKEKIERIYNQLINANDMYRKGEPIMSDYEFDRLESELLKIDPDNAWFNKGVNDKVPERREFKLPYPMMSLNKVKRIEDVKSWMDRFPNSTFVITPKFDGLSVGMTKNKAWTRGDGTIGQLCTEHISMTANKPYVSEDEIIRGEIIIDPESWKQFKEYHPEAKSQRNSATGLINGDFDKEKDQDYQLLTIMPYGSQNISSDKMSELERIGADYCYKEISKEEATEEALNSLFFEWSKKYPMDGIVIDVNNSEYRNGTEANGNPSYTIAYKHPSFSEIGESKIERIELSINRDGVTTPVIHINPELTLAGATISKVTGVNMKYVNDWKMFPGESIKIVRSGEVIPKIVGVGGINIPFRETFSSPKEYKTEYDKALRERNKTSAYKKDEKLTMYCPFCGEELKADGSDDEYVNYICTNNDCTGKKQQKIVKFFDICGLEGFKEAKIVQLIENGKIGNIPFDTFDLKREDLYGIEGWGSKSIDSFIDKLENIRNNGISFARFLHATGYFDDLGEKTIQNILDNVDDYENTKIEELLAIEGVQELTAKKFISGIRKYEENKERINSIFSFSNIKTKINDKNGALNGKMICATGFRDKVMFQKIEEIGGTMLDTVSKATNCLIVKDLSSNSSKLLKARKMGIEIISKEDFSNRYLK